MTEQQPKANLTPNTQPTKVEKINPPKEYSSAKGLVKVTIDDGEVTIELAANISEDIGCYRRIKKILVKFKNGKPHVTIPVALDGNR